LFSKYDGFSFHETAKLETEVHFRFLVKQASHSRVPIAEVGKHFLRRAILKTLLLPGGAYIASITALKSFYVS